MNCNPRPATCRLEPPMKWIIYELRIWNQVKLWSSQLWLPFLQLRKEAWKIQDFNGVWTPNAVNEKFTYNNLQCYPLPYITQNTLQCYPLPYTTYITLTILTYIALCQLLAILNTTYDNATYYFQLILLIVTVEAPTEHWQPRYCLV